MTGRKLFRIGFVVLACISLLVNAVIIGVGVRLADRGVIGGGVGTAIREIPRDIRQEYIAGLRAVRPTLRGLREELKQRRKEMLMLAAEETPDPKALAVAMGEVRRATTRLQAAAHEAMLGTIDARGEKSQ